MEHNQHDRRWIDRLSGNQGFYMLEVLITMAILSIGILAVSKMQMLSTQSNLRSMVRSEGMILAQEALERASGTKYASLPGLAMDAVIVRQGTKYQTTVTVGSEYQIDFTATGGGELSRDVTVLVTYKVGSVPEQITYTTTRTEIDHD